MTFLLVVVALLVAVFGAVFVYWEKVERMIADKLSQAISKKLGVTVLVGGLTLRPTRFGFKNITVANGPGTEPWSAPCFAKIDLMEVTTPSVLATLSLPGLARSGAFVVGFEVREMSTVTMRGVRVFVEEQGTGASKTTNNKFLETFEAQEETQRREKVKAELAAERAWLHKWSADAAAVAELEWEQEQEELEERDLSLSARQQALYASLSATEGKSMGERFGAILELRTKVEKSQARKEETDAAVENNKRLQDVQRIKLGCLTIEDCQVMLLGRTLRLDSAYVLRAFSGTAKDLRYKAAMGVLEQGVRDAVEDAVEHFKETRADNDQLFYKKVADAREAIRAKWQGSGATQPEPES